MTEGTFEFRKADNTEVLRIVPHDNTFDVVIPDGITLNEAAKTFIDAVNNMLASNRNANE